MFLYRVVCSALDRSKRLLHPPGRPVQPDTKSTSLRSIQPCSNYCMKTIHSRFSAVYSQVLIYTAESTGASMERTEMPNLQNDSKGDSNPGSLDCESGILPLSYCAALMPFIYLLTYLLTYNHLNF